eukprot:TRINITY_DN41976_c0_g1_i1.p1 TRINITY_DN41976_c0_g1~~TRINITY_DN41976_c0_g1_i1.p1  ORF type:complete len:463 (+),score=132.35 TRINITY_DN41976_c0_g1_i1:101-1390(+)
MSFCNFKLENFGLSITEAEQAVEADATFVKARYRMGSAHLALRQFDKGLSQFKMVVKQKPGDKHARLKLDQCKKAIAAIRFSEAIRSDEEEKSVFDRLQPDQLAQPPASYKGPVLTGDSVVDGEFCEALTVFQRDGGLLHLRSLMELMVRLRDVLEACDTLVDYPIKENGQVTVCGDTHGQYFDTLNIFEINGKPSNDNPYIFNGDFVDRGSWSIENFLLLAAYKVAYPEHVHLTRGNHETINMNMMYGFQGEVEKKYNKTLFPVFTEVFRLLPLVLVVDKAFFITHGGLPMKEDITLDDIRTLNRKREPPQTGLMADLLWCDPQITNGRDPSPRGLSTTFGPDVTERFLEKHGLKMVIRSHQQEEQGYLYNHNKKCLTVFSAPNYCDQMGNKGAFVTLLADGSHSVQSFTHVPHPDIKPMAYSNNMFM